MVLCKKLCVLALIFFISSSDVQAKDSPVNRLQSPAAKVQTVRALQSINQGQWSVGKKAIGQTRDPLASKLYYWLLFSSKDSASNYTRLTQFIRNNPEWPGMSALRRKAEDDMPANLSAREVNAWFADYPPRTGYGIDRYMQALLATGQKTKAKEFLGKWWANNTLSREQQRSLYRKYSAYLTRDDHRKRFDNLLYKKSYQNARAIAGVLGKGYPQLAEARIALAQEKKGVNALISRVPSHLQNDPGLLYERLRWRRKNKLDVGAMDLLHKMPPADQVQNLPDWWRERHILIRRLIEKKSWKSAYLLASGHQQKSGLPFAQGEWLAGWLALRFLNQPVQAYQHFDKLYRGVKSPISKARAAYWAGRASKGFKDKTIALRWFEIAAQKRTVFYGQLAAAELGKTESLPDNALPTLSPDDKSNFKRKELVQAAALFSEAGMRKEAGQFLSAFVANENTPKAYYYAANKAVELGLLHKAVSISKQATKKGMFLTAQSYPVITQRLRTIDLEWALVHGIIRQESMFDFKAQSPAGALGLMQLMPATAKETAKKIGVKHTTAKLTHDPDHNIRLGSRYLSDMIKRFDGSYPLAIASYNAGPGRVDKWLKTNGDPRSGEMDFIDWIEMIPIYETRNYVQRVMESTYVYRLRLKKVQPVPSTPLHTAMLSN